VQLPYGGSELYTQAGKHSVLSHFAYQHGVHLVRKRMVRSLRHVSSDPAAHRSSCAGFFVRALRNSFLQLGARFPLQQAVPLLQKAETEMAMKAMNDAADAGGDVFLRQGNVPSP
jgi:hypothetical protein